MWYYIAVRSLTHWCTGAVTIIVHKKDGLLPVYQGFEWWTWSIYCFTHPRQRGVDQIVKRSVISVVVSDLLLDLYMPQQITTTIPSITCGLGCQAWLLEDSKAGCWLFFNPLSLLVASYFLLINSNLSWLKKAVASLTLILSDHVGWSSMFGLLKHGSDSCTD